ncbi:MAG: hypothetical protein LBR10_01815 [Prevotellaceae bacterium]|jgi:hypothetical protein|nr:hypothetical protein [Prevotellaceae bacterium]
MKTKKTFLILFLLVGVVTVNAQSLDRYLGMLWKELLVKETVKLPEGIEKRVSPNARMKNAKAVLFDKELNAVAEMRLDNNKRVDMIRIIPLNSTADIQVQNLLSRGGWTLTWDTNIMKMWWVHFKLSFKPLTFAK